MFEISEQNKSRVDDIQFKDIASKKPKKYGLLQQEIQDLVQKAKSEISQSNQQSQSFKKSLTPVNNEKIQNLMKIVEQKNDLQMRESEFRSEKNYGGVKIDYLYGEPFLENNQFDIKLQEKNPVLIDYVDEDQHLVEVKDFQDKQILEDQIKHFTALVNQLTQQLTIEKKKSIHLEYLQSEIHRVQGSNDILNHNILKKSEQNLKLAGYLENILQENQELQLDLQQKTYQLEQLNEYISQLNQNHDQKLQLQNKSNQNIENKNIQLNCQLKKVTMKQFYYQPMNEILDQKNNTILQMQTELNDLLQIKRELSIKFNESQNQQKLIELSFQQYKKLNEAQKQTILQQKDTNFLQEIQEIQIIPLKSYNCISELNLEELDEQNLLQIIKNQQSEILELSQGINAQNQLNTKFNQKYQDIKQKLIN